jgi:hypothetical protein
MIPPVVGDETASPGERELFQRFASEPETEDWVVLHSLDVPHHRRQLMGEIDFVIAVPGQGVLCLEVKSHHSIRRDQDGLWRLGQHPPTRVGPFRQASEGMHSLRKHVGSRLPEFRQVLFWSAVCFTNVSFALRNPAEWHQWQVIDAAALNKKPLARLIQDVLTRARRLAASRATTARWFNDERSTPSARQVESLVNVLRPTFEFFESPKSRRRQREDELLRYTAEQFVALDAMNPALNPRVLFEGAAGTGKTLLALEEARRLVLRGERVLVCCFNRLLGIWLKKEAEPLGSQATTTTFHRYLLDLTGASVPQNPAEAFWQEILPNLALERVLSDQHFEPFDILIVDEAQDLLKDGYLDVLDAIVNGGLGHGRWRFFGDFEQQALYGSSCLPISHVLAQRSPGVPRYLLTRNCRNTPRIAAFTQLLAGFDKGYGSILRPDTGIEPETIYYDSTAGQDRELVKLLDQLFAEGYRGQEIVILSTRANGSAAESITTPPWLDRLKPAEAQQPGRIRYCTVHSYKGLEAPVVIVTDVTSMGTVADKSLFYVAITRATERLYVFLPTSLKPTVLELLLQSKQGNRNDKPQS